jgi:hypothetical protein
MFAVDKVICPRGELEERGFLFLTIAYNLNHVSKFF